MPKAASNDVTFDGARARAYRQKLQSEGLHQLVVALPAETVARIVDTQRRYSLQNRSAALLKLLEEGRPTTQQ